MASVSDLYCSLPHKDIPMLSSNIYTPSVINLVYIFRPIAYGQYVIGSSFNFVAQGSSCCNTHRVCGICNLFVVFKLITSNLVSLLINWLLPLN